MITVEQAQALVRQSIIPVGSETIALTNSLGRVLSESHKARIANPANNVSAMDGYAVRAVDVPELPGSLTVVGESAAGDSYDGELGACQAVRIFTGAQVPIGADTIVIQEDTERTGQILTIKEIRPGRHIRLRGQDFSEGDELLFSPVRLSSRHIGLLAAANHPSLQVHRKPRVAILSTGDEIVLPGEPRGPDQIVSSNGPALSAFVESRGGIPVHMGVAKDEQASLTTMAIAAKDCDLLLTSGGVSVGDKDLVRAAFSEAGLKVAFHKIAMRPGKPLLFGHLDETPVLGLPGNPVSTMVCAYLFAGIALDCLQGLPGNPPEPIAAILSEDINKNGNRQDYMRAVLSRNADGSFSTAPIPKQDSSMIAAFARSAALIVRPIGAGPAKKGEVVPVLPLDSIL